MQRYAIYYAPPRGAFADFTARWLGWDAEGGIAVAHPAVAGLPRPVADLTATPRKYGFHGTIKPPFHLADGTDAAGLQGAVQALAGRLAPVTLPGVQLVDLHGFVALIPQGDTTALAALAADVVMALDPFRAPPTPQEIARRKPDQLTPRQRDLLAEWGYPYVLDQFQFHLTLTGALSDADSGATLQALRPHLHPLVPQPFVLSDLALFGQAEDGMFRILHRYPLLG